MLRVNLSMALSSPRFGKIDPMNMYPGMKRNIASAIGKGTYIEVTGTLANSQCRIQQSLPDIIQEVASSALQ